MADTNKITVTLSVKDDGTATLVTKNLTSRLKTVESAFKNIEKVSSSLDTRMTKLSGVFNEVRKSMEMVGRRSASMANHLAAFNKQMMSLRANAEMLSGAMKSSRQKINELGTATTKTGEAYQNTGQKVRQYAKHQETANKTKDSGMAKAGFLVSKVVRLMLAYMALRQAVAIFSQEMKASFTVVEDYKRGVVELAALQTTFAKIPAGMDPAEMYKKASDYAKVLVVELEKLDAQTIAGAQDLKTMVQTFIMYGVQVDVTNKKAMTGFKALADALKVLVGSYPNQQAQISQEIRAMLLGQARATDTLGKVMKAKLGNTWKDIMAQWRKEGPNVFLEKLGDALAGFSLATKDIEDMWETLTSTIKTVHDIIFRTAFQGLHEHIIGILRDLSNSLRDAEGNLTPLARNIGKRLVEIWLFVKNTAKDLYQFFFPILWIVKEVVKALWTLREPVKVIVFALMATWLAKMLHIMAAVRALQTAWVSGFTAMTLSTVKLNTALNFLKANWIVLAITAITAAFWAAKKAIDAKTKSVEDLRDSLKFLTQEELRREVGKSKKELEKSGGVISFSQDKDLISLGGTHLDIQKQLNELSKEFSDLSKRQIKAAGDGNTVLQGQIDSQMKVNEKKKEYLTILKTEQEQQQKISALSKKATLTFAEDAELRNLTKLNIKTKETISLLSEIVDITQGKKVGVFPSVASDWFANISNQIDTTKANAFKVAREELINSLKEEIKPIEVPELITPAGEEDDSEKELKAIRKILNAKKAIYEDEIKMIADKESEVNTNLDAMLKLREISEQDHFESSLSANDYFFNEKTKKYSAYMNEILKLYDEMGKKVSGKSKEVLDEEKEATRIDITQKTLHMATESQKKDSDSRVADKLKIMQMTEKQLAFEEKYASRSAELSKDMAMIDEEAARKKLEFLKSIDEIGASDYYEKQKELIENNKQLELDALKAKEAAYIKYFYGMLDTALKSKEAQEALAMDAANFFQNHQNELTKINKNAVEARLDIERTASRDLENIYKEKGGIGVSLKALEDVEKVWGKTWDNIYKLTEDVYKDLASSFSDNFYDVITGDLKSLDEYFKKIWQSILRYMTDETGKTMAKLVKEQIMPHIEKAFSSPTGSKLPSVGSFSAATQPVYSLGGNMGFQQTQQPVLELSETLQVNNDLMKGSTQATEANTETASKLVGSMNMAVAAMAAVASAIQIGKDFSEGNTGAGIGGAVGAAGGAVAGFMIGGPVGALVGFALGQQIGSMLGGLFDSSKEQVQKIGVKLSGEVATIATENFDLSKTEKDKIARNFLKFRDTLKDAVEGLGVDIKIFYTTWKSGMMEIKDGNTGQAMARIMKKYIQDTLGFNVKDFKREGENLQAVIERIVGALQGLGRLNVELNTYIKYMGTMSDEMVKWNVDMALLNKDIASYRDALSKAVDPSDFYEIGNALKQALLDKYSMEVDLVNKLSDALEDARDKAKDFSKDVWERLLEFTPEDTMGRYIQGQGFENPNAHMNFVQGSMTEANKSLTDILSNADSSTEDIVKGWEKFKDSVEDWYTTAENSIRRQYEIQIEVIEKEIDVLEKRQSFIKKEVNTLNKQKDIMEDWKDLFEDVSDTIFDMKKSLDSPRDVFERLDYARGEVLAAQSRFRTAEGEDKIKAGKEYHSRIKDYVGVAQEAYQRPSSQYQAIHDESIGWLGELKDVSAMGFDGLEDILEKIRLLDEESLAIDKEIEMKTASIEALTIAMEEDLDALRTDAKAYYDWMKDQGIPAFSAHVVTREQALKDVIGDKSVGEYIIDLRETLHTDLINLQTSIDNFTNALMPTTKFDLDDINEILSLKDNPFKDIAENKDIRQWWKQNKGMTLEGDDLSQASTMLLSRSENPFRNKYAAWQNWWSEYSGDNMPSFATGGYVSKDMVAKLHGGERVLNRQETRMLERWEQSSPTITNTFNITTDGKTDVQLLASVIEDRILTSFKKGKGRKLLNTR